MTRRTEETTRTSLTMVNVEAKAGTVIGTKRRETMEATVEEAVVEAKAEEEAMEATTTTTMAEEVVATTMKAEVIGATTTDTRTTSTRETNNTPSRISSNKCLQHFRFLIQHPVQGRTFKTTTWTATQIKPVAILTVANGATKGNTGRDRPNLVQRVPI